MPLNTPLIIRNNVCGITIASLLSFISPDYISTTTVTKNNPNIHTEHIFYNSLKGGGTIKGLLSIPKENFKKLTGVIVVHKNRGLNPYIKDVCKRTVLEGFISLAADVLSPLGGYPGNDDEGTILQKKRDKYEMLEDFIATYEYLKKHPNCNGKIAVVGFCFGG